MAKKRKARSPKKAEPKGPAPKNIILSSDGTGNRGGKGRGTNVWRLYEAIDTEGHADNPSLPKQLAFYDDGVGSEDSKLWKIFGGAFGLGLKRNTLELYTHLLRCWSPGDRIYLFGFSRGAYTVRRLAGMIAKVGLLRREDYSPARIRAAVEEANDAYRAEGNGERDAFQRKWSVEKEVEIEFMGVWDTVDAVGVPFDELRWFLAPFYKFKNNALSDRVKNGYHAVAIDDERKSFHPVMWDEKAVPEKQTIEQVWFAGVHSNVGGGYPKYQMALVALDWMMSHAHDAGLRFLDRKWEEIEQESYVHSKLYDSRSGLAAFYRYRPRDIEKIAGDHGLKPLKVHVTAIERIAESTEEYAPANLPATFEIVPTDPEDPTAHEEACIEDYGKKIAAASPRWHEEMKATEPWIDFRRGLYILFLFLALGIVEALVFILLSGAPEPTEPVEASSTIREGVGAFLAYFVPDAASKIVTVLWREWVWTLGFVALLLGLNWLRGWAKRKQEDIALKIWKSVLPPPPQVRRT